MFAISSREKKMVILMLGFIAVAVLYKYFFIPYLDTWKSTTAQIQTMKTRIKYAQQLQANPNLALYSQETIKTQTAAVAHLLEQLELWSGNAGVTLTSLRPGPIQNRGNNVELIYDIEITGELGTLCRFITSIEQPGVIARINKIRIAKPKDILADISAGITVSTLSIPDSPPIKKNVGASKNDEL